MILAERAPTRSLDSIEMMFGPIWLGREMPAAFANFPKSADGARIWDFDNFGPEA